MGVYVRSGVVEAVGSDLSDVPERSVELDLTRIPRANVNAHDPNYRHGTMSVPRDLSPMMYAARL